MLARHRQIAAAIPLVFSQDYCIDVHLRIYREKTQYAMDIIAVGRFQRVPIEMSSHDLEILNKQLQMAMQSVTNSYSQASRGISKIEPCLIHLAEVGNFAFKKIFGHHSGLSTIQQLLVPGNRVFIEVASEDFFLPWELLYPVNVENEFSFEYFWGMNYIIPRVIVQQDHPGDFVSPTILITSRPKLGLMTYQGLPSVKYKEIPFFENLSETGRIFLFKLRELDPEKKPDDIREFRGFLTNRFDLAHFACEASYKDDTPSLSHIMLSEEFPITLMDMEVYEVAISGYPLVIMNACGTGNLNPLSTSYFAGYFLKHGARGVVATECDVPDDFAADFSQVLYEHLLAGEPLGQSLLATRRYFLEKHNDPTGLLYSMYASPSIRLVYTGD